MFPVKIVTVSYYNKLQSVTCNSNFNFYHRGPLDYYSRRSSPDELNFLKVVFSLIDSQNDLSRKMNFAL